MAAWGGRSAARLTALTLSTWGTICHLCGCDGADTADHIVPRSRGGTDELANLRPAHRSCNSRRGAMDLAVWHERQHSLESKPTVPPSRVW